MLILFCIKWCIKRRQVTCFADSLMQISCRDNRMKNEVFYDELMHWRCGVMELSLTAEEVKWMLMVTTSSFGHSRRDEVRSKGGWACLCVVGGSVSELADGSQNMKQCRGSVWWVRCTELQAGEQACWANYSLMGSFGRQLPGVNVVWRDEVRLKWNFWLENVFKWKGSRQLCADGVGGWLWADACCYTDHHPSMSTTHRNCSSSPLLFNLIPTHRDHNDFRTF